MARQQVDERRRVPGPPPEGGRAQPAPPRSARRGGDDGPFTGGRIRSLDVARGVVVGLSAFLSHIPGGGYTFATHADWYGLTLLDFILPGFMTLFGVGMSFAYRRHIKWRRFVRRTAVLLAFGLVFNAVVTWDADPATWRLTGVLQAFAVSGVFVTLAVWLTRSWQALTAVGAGFLALHGATLTAVGRWCADGLPQPDCNPSMLLDPLVVGASHIYLEGAAGYDPEGLGTIVGITGSVLLGAGAGRLFAGRAARGLVSYRHLLVFGTTLLIVAVPLTGWLPIGKRVWTPAFALVTTGATIVLLGLCHLVLEGYAGRARPGSRLIHRVAWFPESFGRNSLLVYFGKYMLAAVLANVAFLGLGGGRSVSETIFAAVQWSPRPELTYAVLMFGLWGVIATVMHRKGWYVRA